MAETVWKLPRIFFVWGVAVTCVISLIAGSGTVTKHSIVLLAVFGASAVSIAILEHGWHRGSVVKACLLALAAWASMGLVGYLEWPKQAPSTNGSLVQFDSITLIDPGKELGVGDKLLANYYYKNVGSRTAHDVHAWGLIIALNSTINSNKMINSILDKLAKEGYRKSKDGGDQGGDLGVGRSGWSTAVSNNPLTQDEIDNLKTGKYKLYFFMFGAWMDDSDQEFYWRECEWIDWSIYSQFQKAPTHVC